MSDTIEEETTPKPSLSAEEAWLAARPRVDTFIKVLLHTWDPILVSVVESLLSHGAIKLDDHIKRPNQLLPKTFVKMCVDKTIMTSDVGSYGLLDHLGRKLVPVLGNRALEADPFPLQDPQREGLGRIGLTRTTPEPAPLQVTISVESTVRKAFYKEYQFSTEDVSDILIPHSVLVACADNRTIGPAYQHIFDEYKRRPESQYIHDTNMVPRSISNNIVLHFEMPAIEDLAERVRIGINDRGIPFPDGATLYWEDWMPGNEEGEYDEDYNDEDTEEV